MELSETCETCNKTCCKTCWPRTAYDTYTALRGEGLLSIRVETSR